MKRAGVILAAVAIVWMAAGCCVMPLSPVIAPITVTKGPVAVGDTTVKATKVGRAQVEGILLVASRASITWTPKS
jgi:hypothetical protein